jgi:tetratricopeptide (TPR) repeat protein
MKLPTPTVFLFGLAAACSKGKPEVAAPDVTRPAAETRAAVPEIGPDTASPPTDATAAPDTAPVPDTVPANAEVAPSRDGREFLVWTEGKDGPQTVWLRASGEGRPEVVMTRKQAAGIYDGSLWGFEQVYLPFRETSCEDYNRLEDKAVPNRLRYLPNMRARALAGPQSGNFATMTAGTSAYFDDSKIGEPLGMVGEYYGRTIELVGGNPDRVMIVDCEGGFGCGVHGSHDCEFKDIPLVRDVVPLDLALAEKAIAPDAKASLEAWTKEPDSSDMGTPKLTAVQLLGNGGDPTVSYMFVGDVPYAATRGDWGSYTASLTYIGKPVAELRLGEIPDLVKGYLAGLPPETRFGWSMLPVDAPAGLVEELKKAFSDASTLPSPAPAEEALGTSASTDVDKLIDEGRKLTREKKYAEAIAAFDTAIAASEKAARAWSGRGYAKMLAGELGDAKTDLEKALELDTTPKFLSAVHFNLGEIAEKLKDDLKALEHYEKAHELNPSEATKKRVEKFKGE